MDSPHPHVDEKFRLFGCNSSICQIMQLVISEPKFTGQLPESGLVTEPVALEIGETVLSPLEHCPSTTLRCLVTVCGNHAKMRSVDFVHTGCVETCSFESQAILPWFEILAIAVIFMVIFYPFTRSAVSVYFLRKRLVLSFQFTSVISDSDHVVTEHGYRIIQTIASAGC